jgi:CheY-like chemotaxis protein
VASQLRSILYVEDDLHVRTTAKLVLEVIGKLDVRACRSGPEALELARSFRPDLLLLDVIMPEQDGVDLLRALRRMPHLAEVPALFITGATTHDDMARYAAAGAVGVISKPLAPLMLSDQVQEMWAHPPQRCEVAH